MTVFLFSNNAHTTLAGPVSTGSVTLNLAAGTGALFPNPSTGQQFALTLVSQSNSSLREIVYCTARAGDVCTVARGQEGTSPAVFIAGDFVDNFLTTGATAAFTQATQLQQQAGDYATDTGTVNNIVATFNPAPASLAQLIGVPLRIRVANANTSVVTLKVNALAATTVVNTDGTAMRGGQLPAAGIAMFMYDGARFQLLAYSLLGSVNVWAGANTFPSIAATTATIGNLSFSGNTVVTGAGGVAFSGAGGVSAVSGRLRASLGAAGSGDQFAAAILADFPSSFTAPGYFKLPSGWIVQMGAASTRNDVSVFFPTAFPNFCVAVVVSESNCQPQTWGVDIPTLHGTSGRNVGGFIHWTLSWTGAGWLDPGNNGFVNQCDYIAIGF